MQARDISKGTVVDTANLSDSQSMLVESINNINLSFLEKTPGASYFLFASLPESGKIVMKAHLGDKLPLFLQAVNAYLKDLSRGTLELAIKQTENKSGEEWKEG
jgi:hypothetical protein